ncbi:MAG: hypothetical protein MJ180_01090 [Candidatus Gastranaerophilales bacterium]|nr:hypothetical protein [Candidatus Gastranaerophilales bacterium]
MITELVNFLGRTLSTRQTAQVTRKLPVSQNPFAMQSSGNPFVNSYTNQNNPFYGKNKPVSGGYFAGYYNGKPNIVGTRLFIEA